MPADTDMQETRTYKDLTVWKVSLDLVAGIYRLTDGYPRSEMFGMVAQMRRAAVSVCANLAEGNSRCSTAAYINHVHVALGSVGELGALLEVSRRLGFVTEPQVVAMNAELARTGRLLSGLRAALKRRSQEHHLDS